MNTINSIISRGLWLGDFAHHSSSKNMNKAKRIHLALTPLSTHMKTLAAITAAIIIAASSPTVFAQNSGSSSGPRTTPATESIKGQLVGLAQLVDAGNATPEAAWESRYWARAQGDYDAVIAATDPQMVDAAKDWMGDKATFHARSQTDFTSFKGIQILALKNLAADRVQLKYKFGFGKRQETKIVEMVKIEGAWKSGQTRAWDASWDDGSQPEPQS